MNKLMLALFGAAMVFAPSAAGAVSLSLAGNSGDYADVVLGSSFDLDSNASYPTYTTFGGTTYGVKGDHVSVIAAGDKDATNGLFVSAPTKVAYTYLGKEAGNTNTFNLAVGASLSTTVFSTGGATPAAVGDWSGPYDVLAAGLLQFALTSIDNTHYLFNNASATSKMDIAYLLISSTKALVFLDDYVSYTPDQDFDDIGILVSIVPVPAALPLFGSGLAFLGWLGMRKRRGAMAAAV